jgi:hypothetical protein
VLGGIALRVDSRFFGEFDNLPRHTGGIEKSLDVKVNPLAQLHVFNPERQ